MPTRTSVRAFFDASSGTVTYVVSDDATAYAAIVDTMLDFDMKAGRTSTAQAEKVLGYLAEGGLKSNGSWRRTPMPITFRERAICRPRVGGRIAIGERIREVQASFKKLYNLERESTPTAPSPTIFPRWRMFQSGSVEAVAMLVPGHTPADMAYRVEGAVFVGDTLFMPDVGTARADFPGGNARDLFKSIRRLLDLPPETTIYVCHDYPPNGRAAAWETTVAQRRVHNIHVHDGVGEDEFFAMRTARDATLEAPRRRSWERCSRSCLATSLGQGGR